MSIPWLRAVNLFGASVKNAMLSSLGLILIGSGLAHAQTAAGTQIQAQATANYKDDIGNAFSAQSNIAIVEVQQVFSAYTMGDAHKFVQAGAEVSFPFTVTNTGNGEDTFSVALHTEWITWDDIDFASIKFYLDTNGNGLADAGEAEASSFTLAAGATQNLVFVGAMPIAASGARAGLNIEVTTPNGTVADNNGLVGVLNKGGVDVSVPNKKYVNFMATITDNAILELSQVAVADHANDQITFTTTVTNVGGREARDVVIFNGTPFTRGAFRGAMIEVSQSASGFGTTIDAADTDLTLIDGPSGAMGTFLEEAVLGDMNGDGDTSDVTTGQVGLELNGLTLTNSVHVPGIWGVDDTLAAGASVSMSFTVQYVEGLTDPGGRIPRIAAGTIINNTAFATGDLDGDGNRDPYHASNTTQTVIPQTYGAIINTDVPTSTPGVNDGGQDYATPPPNTLHVYGQTISDELLFKHKVINTGNGTDAIELAVADRFGFVPHSNMDIDTLQLFQADGITPLLNTNGIGDVDTGPMAPNEEKIIIVKARVVAGSAPSGRMDYGIAANSAMDTTPRREPLDHDNGLTDGLWNTQTNNYSFGSASAWETPSQPSLSYGIDFSGFNPTPPASGPGSAATPFTSLADAKTVLNKGRYVFDLGAGAFEADVDTAEGGGWVLVMQYIHQGGTNPAVNAIGANADLPVTSNAALGDDESASTSTWGHTGTAAIQQFFDAGTTDIETRWYGQTSNHNRIIHFYSTIGDDALRTGTGDFDGIQNDFVDLTDHSANLPGAATDFPGPQIAEGNHPFYTPFTYHWSVKSHGGRWEVDDFTGAQNDTHHRVWIRDTAVPTAGVNLTSLENGGGFATGDPGDTVSLPVVIRNNGSISESYSLTAGKSYISGTLGAMHDGWSAVFKNGSGTPVVSTSLVPPGGEWTGTMEVAISSTFYQARYASNNFAVIDDSGTVEIDPNADGDDDYAIFVVATGNNTGHVSAILNAVDVNRLANQLIAGGSGQVRPGSHVDMDFEYFHDNSQHWIGHLTDLPTFPAGWNASLLVDTDGDLVPDEDFTLLAVSDTVYAKARSGAAVAVTKGNTLGVHPQNQDIILPFALRVFAPSNASAGQVISFTEGIASGSNLATATATITVVDSPLSLTKTTALDAGCTDTDAGVVDLGPDGIFEGISASALPGDCAIWQVVATNISTSPVNEVALADTIPPFSTYKTGSLRACVGNAGVTAIANCTFTVLDDADDGADEASAVGNNIIFSFGSGATSILAGGTLQGGESVTMRYATKIE